MGKATIKDGDKTYKIDIPDGYRRVVNGYTRTGDLAYVICAPRPEWKPVMELKIVRSFLCVARKKDDKGA